VVVPNRLQVFVVSGVNQYWVSDITYIRTYEGWLYLCVVMDLYSRQVIGGSMCSRLKRNIVLNELFERRL